MTDINFLALQSKLTDVASEHINSAFAELPPIHWTYTWPLTLSGLVPEAMYDDPEQVAQAWRAQFGLDAGGDWPNGTRTFSGVIDDVVRTNVDIWYVADRERFEG